MRASSLFLVALGIHDRATPALASLVARLSTRCASFEEASETLGEHGIDMDAKTVRRLTLHVGEEALRQRDRRVEAATEGQAFRKELAGRRIVVSVDGGRVRLREGGRRGRKRKNGRRGYKTPWREPKIFTVYVIDEAGRKVHSFLPLIDETLGHADATFDLLVAELVLRGDAAEAATAFLRRFVPIVAGHWGGWYLTSLPHAHGVLFDDAERSTAASCGIPMSAA